MERRHPTGDVSGQDLAQEDEARRRQIMMLLLAAGYFRARLKGLPDFDKVLGGLVWCLEVCNFDVDIDLFPGRSRKDEDLSTIGAKIALTERVVAALCLAKCPHRIEPHQVQGLDYSSLLPAFQWLIQRAMESKDAKGESLRAETLWHHGHFFGDDGPGPVGHATGLPGDQAPPRRRFRQRLEPGGAKPDDLALRVDNTLREYGRLGRQAQGQNQGPPGQPNEDRLEDVVDFSGSDIGEEPGVNVRAVGRKVNLDELHEAAEKFERLKAGPSGKELKKVLEDEKRQLQGQLLKLQAESQALQQEASKSKASLAATKGDLERLRKDTAEVAEVSPEDHSKLKRLQHALSKLEGLKKRELELRNACRGEKGTLEDRNRRLAARLEEMVRSEASDGEASPTSAALEELRRDLAHRSAIVISLEQRLDQVPSAFELAQYQKRFMELDDQVSSEFSETQRFVILFNALVDQLDFVNRQALLMDSVRDGIPDYRYSNTAGKARFIEQLSKLKQGLDLTLGFHRKALKELELKRAEAKDEVTALTDQIHRYNVLVKELGDEAEKNQSLIRHLEEKSRLSQNHHHQA